MRAAVPRAMVVVRLWCVLVCLGLSAIAAVGQASQPPSIPGDASALEGIPTVKMEATQEEAKRRTLSRAEAAAETLAIKVVNGRYYWASQGNQPLTPSSSGEFTYLTSTVPGRYVRLRKVNDTLTYVEHLDMGSRSVTYWGELRVVLKK